VCVTNAERISDYIFAERCHKKFRVRPEAAHPPNETGYPGQIQATASHKTREVPTPDQNSAHRYLRATYQDRA
jgi:hypothetical protein